MSLHKTSQKTLGRNENFLWNHLWCVLCSWMWNSWKVWSWIVCGSTKIWKNQQIVRFLTFSNQSRALYLPRGIPEIFPNLTQLALLETGLKELNAENLIGLEKLEILNLSNNDLTCLPNDLFSKTTKLSHINLSGNQLRFVSSCLFNCLEVDQIDYISLINNTSVNVCYEQNGKISFREFKKIIDSSCLPPPTNLTRESSTSSNPSTDQYRKIWDYRKLHDFSIIVDSEEIPVHKIVLAIKSPVFASMFETDEKVNLTNKLEIKDCNYKIVETFFHSLYTGKVDSEDEALELFSLACTFDVSALKRIYEEIATRRIDKDNAMRALKLGNIFNSEKLVEAAFREIKLLLPDQLTEELKREPEKVEEKWFAAVFVVQGIDQREKSTNAIENGHEINLKFLSPHDSLILSQIPPTNSASSFCFS